jgi:type I restriction enzyme M protein
MEQISGRTTWRSKDGKGYDDVAGFCKSASLDEIRAHSYVLTPGRYVGAEELVTDDEPFDEKLARLTTTLDEQFTESRRLEGVIRSRLKGVGLGE